MEINEPTHHRLSSSMTMLNARIARLAIGLGVKLDDPNTLTQLMAQPKAPAFVPDRRQADQADASKHHSVGPERRTAHQYEELRGLLVLRYQMEADSVVTHGLQETHQMLSRSEDDLVRRGFKPGADGVSLDDFVGAP